MKSKPVPPAPTLFLGIEGGGTRTVALLAEAGGRLVQRLETGPANLRLLSDTRLIRHLREIAAALPARPSAVAVGLAGARGEPEWRRIRAAATRVWPRIPCHATSDLETALAAAPPVRSSKFKVRRSKFPRPSSLIPPPSSLPQVLVLSGTGSCFYGRTPTGRTVRFGGWGHILGDKGSGFEIGLRALKAVVFYYDRDGDWSRLGQQILRVVALNAPDDLVDWIQRASKTDIAALAIEVFKAAAKRDPVAGDILEGAAHSLATDAVNCATKLLVGRDAVLASPKSGSAARRSSRPVQFVFAGSVLLKQPAFARKVARLIRERWPGAIVTPLKRESAWGAVALAQDGAGILPAHRHAAPGNERTEAKGRQDAWPALIPPSRGLSPTEQRHPLSMRLDRMTLSDAIGLMLRDEGKVPAAVLRERRQIERAALLIIRAFKRGGRLFYVGAGTSGRLGILDASECPPTFRADPELVQGIIAGGQRAITTAVEGAEDDFDGGARAIRFRGVTRRDVVVGIAASGRTPFVWGALGEARRTGAATVLICFNPHLDIPRALRPTVVITPKTGPEILAGSTRLKAGTATKLILNLLTTLAMVRLGKVLGNLMVDLNPSNVKLRDRAVRIVCELTGADADLARAALVKCGWRVRNAVRRVRREMKRSAPVGC
jgi:N-acetylmuramic acid 6-phosphate etherase